MPEKRVPEPVVVLSPPITTIVLINKYSTDTKAIIRRQKVTTSMANDGSGLGADLHYYISTSMNPPWGRSGCPRQSCRAPVVVVHRAAVRGLGVGMLRLQRRHCVASLVLVRVPVRPVVGIVVGMDCRGRLAGPGCGGRIVLPRWRLCVPPSGTTVARTIRGGCHITVVVVVDTNIRGAVSVLGRVVIRQIRAVHRLVRSVTGTFGRPGIVVDVPGHAHAMLRAGAHRGTWNGKLGWCGRVLYVCVLRSDRRLLVGYHGYLNRWH